MLVQMTRNYEREREGEVEVGGLAYYFLKINKTALILEIVSVKFSIQNVVLRLSRREKSEILPCGTYFSCVFNKMFIEVP